MGQDAKAAARAALLSLVNNDLEALQDHPGYWQSRKYFPVLFAGITQRSLVFHDQVAEGDIVATRATLEGIHTGEFLGAAPTGQKLSVDLFNFDRVEDGKVVQHNATADLVGPLGAFGMLQRRPTAD